MYLRCPTPRDFYTRLSRMQQTIHQRMSLPSIAFDEHGGMDQTYDAYDDDVGPFNSHLYDEDEHNDDNNDNDASGGGALLGQGAEEGGVRDSGDWGGADDPQAKAARIRAREMREKLSKTDYMKELEQKTKDCWESTLQFQEDRSAMYRKAPKVAADKAKRVLLAATRGGQDLIGQIPKLDVVLRMLGDTPKMEWSRRRDRRRDGVDEGDVSFTMQGGQSSMLGHGKSRGSPPRPPPPMIAVKKFDVCDLRNPKDLYQAMHGTGYMKRRMRRERLNSKFNNTKSVSKSASLPNL